MKRRLLSMWLMVGLASVARAANPHYLSASAVDVQALLPPPPIANSSEAAAEMQAVLRLQNDRSAADIARAKAEAKLTPAAFQPVLGADFTDKNFPALFALLDEAGTDSKVFSAKAKEDFSRPRPYRADTHVQPVVDLESDFSYPSGHATRGMLWACILSQVVPERKAELLQRGQEIGWDRVVAGVHYPSDVSAGRVLGQRVSQLLLSSQEFQSRLATAKAEFKRAGQPHSVQALEGAASH